MPPSSFARGRFLGGTLGPAGARTRLTRVLTPMRSRRSPPPADGKMTPPQMTPKSGERSSSWDKLREATSNNTTRRRGPRTAKGSSSIVQRQHWSELRTFRLLRYPVGKTMPLTHLIWSTLDDPGFVNERFPTFAPFRFFAKYYSWWSIFLITFSSTAFCLQDDMNCKAKTEIAWSEPPTVGFGHPYITAENCQSWETAWQLVEVVAVACFTLELVLRFWTTPDRRLFVTMSFNWIDLMAVLPFYLEVIYIAIAQPDALATSSPAGQAAIVPLGSNFTGGAETAATMEPDPGMQALAVLRVLRLARIFKLLKQTKASQGLQLVSATAGNALADSLQLMTALVMVTGISMIVFAAAMNAIEPGEDQGHQLEPSDPGHWFMSTPRSCFWAIVTITGVGYGDEFPLFALGRISSMLCAFVGILIIAVPIEVIGRYFVQHFMRYRECTTFEKACERRDGSLNMRIFLAKLRHLDQKGLVKVQCPMTEEEAAELVSHYDSKQNLHLEHEEWSAMLEDVVTHRGDWSGCAVRKTVADLVEIRQEIAEIGLELDDIMKVKRERYAALIRHVKARGGGGAKHKGEAPPP